MKSKAGLQFMLACVVLLAAALAGGQVWAVTGSTPLGAAAGVVLAALLGAACRPLLRRLPAGRRTVMGEYRGSVRDEDFTEVVDVVTDASPRGRLRHGVEQRPERVAESVRAALGKGKPR